MTAKEKAEELVERFLKGTYLIHSVNIKTIDQVAKKCALICVEEIIKSTPTSPCNNDIVYKKIRRVQAKEFWEQVKQEIEKL